MQTRCKCLQHKQRWNNDKCRYKCKELIDKGICDKGFIWKPSNCKCECDKSCDVGEYLDYENCNCFAGQLINQQKNVVKILMKMR